MPKRGMRGRLGSAAHIKSSTKGTSNEISFSVLDAAKEGGKRKKGRTSGAVRPGRVALFSLPGIKRHHETPRREREALIGDGEPDRSPRGAHDAGFYPANMLMPPTSLEVEVERRKKRRRLRRLILGTIIAAVAVAGAAAISAAAISAARAHEGSVSELRAMIEMLSDIDATIVRLDAVVENPLSGDASEDKEALLAELSEQSAALSTAAAGIEAVYDGIVVPGDREAATNALWSIDSRLSMIEAGAAVVEESIPAAQAYSVAVEAWEEVLSADSLARDAAAGAAEATEEGLSASTEQTNEAISALQNASSLLSQVAQAYSFADLSAFQTYIDKRIEALEHAVASNEALAAEDTARAISENDAYNAADAEATALASDMPESPALVIEEAFAARSEDDVAAYESARARASSTDSYVRSYMAA